MYNALMLSAFLDQAIIGEWSFENGCDDYRITFNEKNEYRLKEKKNKKWITIYKSEYEIYGDIIRGGNPYYYPVLVLLIDEISDTSLHYCFMESTENIWNCNKANVYKKCDVLNNN